MGLCTSCEVNNKPSITAKLILEDGELQEYSYPVKVSYLLQTHPSIFICNSDDMEFDGHTVALRDYEELQLGQLYFALPLSQLKRTLQPEEMAALAVKASAALMKSNGVNKKCRGCKKNGVAPLLWGEIEVKERDNYEQQQQKSNGKSSRRSSGGGGRGRGKKFAANLSAIEE